MMQTDLLPPAVIHAVQSDNTVALFNKLQQGGLILALLELPSKIEPHNIFSIKKSHMKNYLTVSLMIFLQSEQGDKLCL